jgi:hypothetical protein
MPQGSNIALYLGSAYGITLGVLALLRVTMALRIRKLRQEHEALHG